MKRKMILTVLGIMISITLVIGLSYAYFSATVTNTNKTETVIKTKELAITFTGGTEINASSIIPGESFTKTFTVENKSTSNVIYNIYLEDIINEFNSDLVYVLKKGTTTAIEEKALPTTKDGKTYIKNSIPIAPGVTDSYTLTVTYLYTEEDQNAYQGSRFSATLGIDTAQKIDEQVVDLSDKKTIWLGDSIIAGYGNDNGGFPEYYKTQTSAANTINRGFGGSTISDNTPQVNADPITIMSSINYLTNNIALYQDVDLIVLDGGGNDSMLYDLDAAYGSYKKEIGTVGVSGNTVINDYVKIIDTLQTNFPNAKILYIQPFSYSQEAIENLVFNRVAASNSLPDLNSWLGTNASSKEELKSTIVKIFTDGTVSTAIPSIKSRADSLFPQIKTVMDNKGLDYLDLTGFVNISTDLQTDGIHINDTGYTKLTSEIVKKVSSMF